MELKSGAGCCDFWENIRSTVEFPDLARLMKEKSV
jgi:hypothetical protein